jgi:mannonate dehydratase
MQVEETVSDDDLTWIKQMGVNYLNVQTGTGRATLENFVAIKKTSRGRRVEGLEQIQQRQPQHEEITLNLPGRDRKIEWLKQYIRGYGQSWCRLHHLCAHGQWHMATPTWES